MYAFYPTADARNVKIIGAYLCARNLSVLAVFHVRIFLLYYVGYRNGATFSFVRLLSH